MLWQLIRGLYSTLNLMFNTAVLVTLLLYIFACLGVELITKEPEGLPPDLMERHFTDIGPIMLSLVQFVTVGVMFRKILKPT